MEGRGVDQVTNCFCLSEVETTGEEGALSKFSGLGESCSGAKALADKEIEEDGRAVGGDFYDVFGGVGVGFLEPGDDGFVEGLAGVVEDFGEAGLGGGEGMSQF